MDTLAVVLEAPERLTLRRLDVTPPKASDVVVEVRHSGVSTGTERLLWSGRMPPFPGMGYPLVPGYEAVGEVVEAGPDADLPVGASVFVPGASCYTSARGLFGASAARVVVPAARVVPVASDLGRDGVLLALASTAHHALGSGAPDLVVGHGVLGRLIARIVVAKGGEAPTVWENRADRVAGAVGYPVVASDADPRRDYRRIVDASGDADLLDTLIARLAKGGEVVLAGFYPGRVGFAFAPAFMREARLRVAAEWAPADLAAVMSLVDAGRLDLTGLVTHARPAGEAVSAYPIAFDDPACLKLVLDWKESA